MHIVDKLKQAFGRPLDITNLTLLLGSQIAIDAVQQQTGKREHGIQWDPEFVAHVRKEMGRKSVIALRSGSSRLALVS